MAPKIYVRAPPRRVYRKRARKVSKPIKLAIAKAIRAQAPQEVKMITSWNNQFASTDVFGVAFNSYVTTGSNYGLVPPLSLGTAVGTRLGNKVHPKRLTVDFWVNPANLVGSADMIARLFVLESKNIRNGSPTAIAGIGMTEMLNWGQVQGSFNGYTSHLSAPVNKNQFIVHSDRLIKMNKAVGEGPTLTNGYTGSTTAPTQNTLHHYRINLKLPKVFTYADNNDSYPEGYAPFFNAGYCMPISTAGTDVPDLTVSRLLVSWQTTLYYTDA